MRIDNLSVARQRKLITEKGIAGAMLIGTNPTGRVSYSLRGRAVAPGGRLNLLAGRTQVGHRLLLQIRITGGQLSQIYLTLNQSEVSPLVSENNAACQFLIEPDTEFETGFRWNQSGSFPSIFNAFITAEYV